MTATALPVEMEIAELLAQGHSRTRATELAIERAVARAMDFATVVLVEGLSDQIALEVIASRSGRNLSGEGVAVVPMGGATNIARFVSLFGPSGRGAKLAGLYDSDAEDHVRRALTVAGPGHAGDLTLEALGFFACRGDLEDELIRSLGVRSVELILERQGELRSFRTMQREPHHRARDGAEQLHRFIGRERYRNARLLAEAVDLRLIPQPLEGLLNHVGATLAADRSLSLRPRERRRRA
jgi:hypothetical protein